MEENLKYDIALSLVPGIGPVVAKKLITAIGSAVGVFKETPATLKKVPGIGEILVSRINAGELLPRAEKEMDFISRNKIKPYFYFNEDYPERLKMCSDAPIMLYFRGNADLNAQKIISIVGTRRATQYGKDLCQVLLSDLAKCGFHVLVVSGLAYGIDICSHRASLKNGFQTVAVLGHGLDNIYPKDHAAVARKMIGQGGLLTEFPSNSPIDPKNFVRRNRIIAGLSDATIVIESAIKGGSLITASQALSYSREVFAFPGRCGDPFSAGCNKLVKTNRAALIESAADLIYNMGWDQPETMVDHVDPVLFEVPDVEEQKLYDVIDKAGEIQIGDIAQHSELSMNRVSALLLSMEMKNYIESLPGRVYRIRKV